MEKLKKLKTKYFSLSVAVRAAVWFTFCNLLQKGITMISMPIFTRLLTTEQYGEFTVYQSWYSIINVIVTFNLSGNLILNGMSKYENRRNEFISSIQTLSSCITICFFIAYLIFHNFFNHIFGLSTLFMVTMFAQMLFEPAYLFWSQRQRYEYKYKGLVIVTLITSSLGPIIGVIAVLSTQYKAEARVISFAIVQICAGLIFYIIQSIRGKTFFNKEFWRFALSFSIPLIPHYLSQIVLGQSDRIMIDKMIGASEAAIYGVSYNLAAVITLFVNAINNSFVPTLYESLKSKKCENIKKVTTFLAIFMAALICVFMLFGPEILTVFVAPEYIRAKWIFPPVAASMFFTFIYLFYVNVEFYFEKTNYVMFVSVLGAVVNIILNLVFIKKYGFIAAGYTTVFSYIVFCFAHYLLYKYIAKKEKTGNVYNDGIFMILGIAVLAFMLICILLYKFNIVRYILIALTAVFAVIFRKKLLYAFKKALNK